MRVINIPIEPIPMRYSGKWWSLIPKEFKAQGVECVSVVGEQQDGLLQPGAFLDPIKTTMWKQEQLAELTRMVSNGAIRSGDILFFNDLWFPGIEYLFYLRDALNVQFKVAGLFHAGTYDPNDWTAQQGMSSWAYWMESMIVRETDLVFVASDYHADILVGNRAGAIGTFRVRVLDSFPRAWPKDLALLSQPPENGIRFRPIDLVFPHRLVSEKGHHLWYQLKGELPKYNTFETEGHCRDKAAYYQFLMASRVAISLASQETWGIAMREAVLCGCFPLVPDRLSYPSFIPREFRYEDRKEMMGKLDLLMNNDRVEERNELAGLLQATANKIEETAAHSIRDIVDCLRRG